MGRLHSIQISFPGGAANGDEAPRADRVDGSIFVHAVGKLKMYKVIRGHCLADLRGAMGTEYCRNYLYVTGKNPGNNDAKSVLPVDYSFSGPRGRSGRNGKGRLPFVSYETGLERTSQLNVRLCPWLTDLQGSLRQPERT